MDDMKREIPVYLFTGFLEAGKTRFITETLRDKEFNDGKRKYLIVRCEDGEEEYDPDGLSENVAMSVVDDVQKLTVDRLSAMQKRANADCLVVEYNGMWMLDAFYNAMPENFVVFQEVLVADSTTFSNYNANMRQLVVDKLTSCEMVIFNRTDEKTDKLALHKIVRGVNRKTNICYENTDGEIEFDQIPDPLPYDIHAPVITIRDEDFAVFYRDMSEEFEKYDGKTVEFKGVVARDPSLPNTDLAIGRHIMTCCEADIAYRGVVAKGHSKCTFKTRDWVKVVGKLSLEHSVLYQGEGPVLTIISICEAKKPAQEVATFY